MARLHIDEYTGSIIARGLKSRVREGQDPLKIFGQSLDEELKRFGVDPESGTRNLLSTMGNFVGFRNKKGTYSNTSLIRPDKIPAEKRVIAERFIGKVPGFLGDLSGDQNDITLNTLLLKARDGFAIHLDDETNRAFVLLKCDRYPVIVQKAMSGKRLGEIIHHDLDCNPLIISAEEDDNPESLIALWRPKYDAKTRSFENPEGMYLKIEIEYPGKKIIDFDPIYQKNYF